MAAPVSAQEPGPAAADEDSVEGTRPPQPPSVVREKWCDPRDWGCFTREQVERIAEIGKSEQRCRESLSRCRGDHQVKAETWSTGVVILVTGAALLAGVLIGGGTVLLIK